MSENFISRYLDRVEQTNSVLCVGLDLTTEHVPSGRIKSGLSGVQSWGEDVIDVAAPLAPVVKLQYAHYAARGPEGQEVLRRLLEYANCEGLLTILDFKRTDIGDTMELYAREAEHYDPDACTLGGPYFGPTFWPAWKEWLADGRMVIQMVRTSNKNRPEDDLQMQRREDGRYMYEWVAERVAAWHAEVAAETDGLGAVGAVVGATQTDEAARCRELLGDDVFVLAPGYGAQGGGAAGAVAGLVNSRGQAMGTVNSSRGITWHSWWDKQAQQSREGDPLELVEAAIQAANTDLNAARTARANALDTLTFPED